MIEALKDMFKKIKYISPDYPFLFVSEKFLAHCRFIVSSVKACLACGQTIQKLVIKIITQNDYTW